jgi:hypothetical protein
MTGAASFPTVTTTGAFDPVAVPESLGIGGWPPVLIPLKGESDLHRRAHGCILPQRGVDRSSA